MATYYVDFNVMLFATKVIEADSAEQAKKVAEDLLNDDWFWREQLLPMFRDSEIDSENADVDIVDAGAAVEIFEDDERFMTAEQIAEYLD